MKRIKVFTGVDVIRRCVRKGKNMVCMPKGKAFKFPGYYYAVVEDETKIPSLFDSNETIV